jgi:hypothetical protein
VRVRRTSRQIVIHTRAGPGIIKLELFQTYEYEVKR